MITGLDLLFLEINRLEESLAFYEGVLGMEVESVNLDSEPPMAKVRGGALRITLAQNLETMLRRGRGVGQLSPGAGSGEGQRRSGLATVAA